MVPLLKRETKGRWTRRGGDPAMSPGAPGALTASLTPQVGLKLCRGIRVGCVDKCCCVARRTVSEGLRAVFSHKAGFLGVGVVSPAARGRCAVKVGANR